MPVAVELPKRDMFIFESFGSSMPEGLMVERVGVLYEEITFWVVCYFA